MGTENAILAATLAEGHSVIRPAALEPETDDLIAFLRKMGADVERTYPDTVEVNGKRRLRGAEHEVIPDRIEAGTFVVAAAVTGGTVRLERAPCDHLGRSSRSPSASASGSTCGTDTIDVDGTPWLAGGYRADVETAPYPGLATDLQPPTGVLLSQATGTSNVHETIFEDRLEWLGELRKMGADVQLIDDHHAAIAGPSQAPRGRGRDRRPACRRLAHPGRPRGHRHDHDPRCSSRSPGL